MKNPILKRFHFSTFPLLMFSSKNLGLHHASELPTNEKSQSFPSLACSNFEKSVCQVTVIRSASTKFITASHFLCPFHGKL